MNSKNSCCFVWGQSSEHDVSLISACNIISNIDTNKYFVLTVGITRKGQWMLYNGPLKHIETGEWENLQPCFYKP